MLTLAQTKRLLGIQRVLIRHGLDELVFALHIFRSVRFIERLLPWNWWSRKKRPNAERVRLALEELGPIYVKFGQILSTRRDLLPEAYANELAKLQDNVPPFSGDLAKDIIEQALDGKIDELFLEFDEQPLASASIAQVHSATLKDGRQMIVKVVRSDIEKIIKRDLSLMHVLAAKAEVYWAEVRKLKPTNVVSEFEKTLLEELDLMREAANASQLRRNFKDSELMYVPEVEWDLTTSKVMVMEKITGIPVSDIQGLRAAGVDMHRLAENGIELFLTQVVRDSFFHADMHPGNIFIRPGENGDAQIAVVDFGIMSSLSEFDQRYLAENFLAFLNRDYKKVATLHVESGWVPSNTRVDEFESAIRTVCEPMFDRSLHNISFGTILLRLFQTARQFNMPILPQLILLQKTLVNVEGLGRQLDPDLDVWKTTKPLFEHWMSKRVGLSGLIEGTKYNVPHWLERLPDMPNKIIDLVEKMREGKIHVEWHSEELERLQSEMQQYNRRNILAIIGSSLVLGGVVLYGLYGLDGNTPVMIGQFPLVSWILGGVGAGVLWLATRGKGR
ncbi:MAG: ubiquinone biosynthesis regulatory protein kinase UbiB [Gammaproteobacteria bacterium]|nr:ubiquinone biosynthesis regulatory protein kinase UbiB [Gammaproteobacteria bacterium]